MLARLASSLLSEVSVFIVLPFDFRLDPCNGFGIVAAPLLLPSIPQPRKVFVVFVAIHICAYYTIPPKQETAKATSTAKNIFDHSCFPRAGGPIRSPLPGRVSWVSFVPHRYGYGGGGGGEHQKTNTPPVG